MPSLPQSANALGCRRAAGFTVIELMVGIAVGLVATLAVAHVLVSSEGQKRTVMAGAEAQVNGSLAIDMLRRRIAPAGYGFASVPLVMGCPLSAMYNSAAVPGLPARLVPVDIDDGAANGPDTIRVFYGGKRNFSAPLRVVAAGYDPNSVTFSQMFEVSSGVGVEGPGASSPGDLLVAAKDSVLPCEMFEATGSPGETNLVPRADNASRWNPTKFPTAAYGNGSFLVNLGRPVDITYSIVDGSLRARTLSIGANGAPTYSAFVELFSDVVQMQAMYGKDTNGDGTVDAWNTGDPANNDEWRQVIAVRIAIVTRSTQQEREVVTPTEPVWNVGNAINIAGTAACGSSKCLTLKVRKDNADQTWKYFRYRVYETIVPLRNMVWNS